MKTEYSIENGKRKYSINLHWFNEDCILEDHEVRTAIEYCASHYHENHGGRERTWPLTISFYVDGKKLGEEQVARSYDPVFECV